MTNTPQLEHWTVDMLRNTQHHAHTERLEKRVKDLEKRIEELERVFYEKVDQLDALRTDLGPIFLRPE